MLAPYWMIRKQPKFDPAAFNRLPFWPPSTVTDDIVRFELRMVKEVKMVKGELRAFYECTECGNCGCPSFKVEALTTPPDYIIDHLVTHVRFVHEV